jgi:O-antigen/teichoic acid export membrane protein
MAGDLPSLRNGFLNVLSVIVLLVLPAGAGITVTADLLVPVVLGPNWMDTVILIQILAWYGVCMAVQTNTGIMFVAMGKPQVLTALAGGYLVVLFPSMAWLTLQYGAIGAALAVAGSALLFLPINYYVLLSSIELQLSRVLAVFWRPAAATAIMVCIVEVIEWQLMNAGEPLAPLLKLLLLIAAGVIAYVATLSSLWRLANCPDGPEQFIWDNVIRRLKVLGWKQ